MDQETQLPLNQPATEGASRPDRPGRFSRRKLLQAGGRRPGLHGLRRRALAGIFPAVPGRPPRPRFSPATPRKGNSGNSGKTAAGSARRGITSSWARTCNANSAPTSACSARKTAAAAAIASTRTARCTRWPTAIRRCRSSTPIEKKPSFHFLPGSTAFSFATTGCGFRCLNCQNWNLSQRKPEELKDPRGPAFEPEARRFAVCQRRGDQPHEHLPRGAWWPWPSTSTAARSPTPTRSRPCGSST